VQPEHRPSLRVTEFGEVDLAVLANRDVSFELGAGNLDGHVQQPRM